MSEFTTFFKEEMVEWAKPKPHLLGSNEIRWIITLDFFFQITPICPYSSSDIRNTNPRGGGLSVTHAAPANGTTMAEGKTSS